MRGIWLLALPTLQRDYRGWRCVISVNGSSSLTFSFTFCNEADSLLPICDLVSTYFPLLNEFSNYSFVLNVWKCVFLTRWWVNAVLHCCKGTEKAAPYLRRLVAGFPPRRPGYKPGSGHVRFCDGQKWRWGRSSPRTSVSPAQSTFHLLLHNHLHYHPRLAQ
jgi:hypothetical protein